MLKQSEAETLKQKDWGKDSGYKKGLNKKNKERMVKVNEETYRRNLQTKENVEEEKKERLSVLSFTYFLMRQFFSGGFTL